jgi:hypothetical protein
MEVCMKKQGIFPGIILIGFGLYFLFQQLQLQIFQDFFSWPSFLVIIGIALFGQAYSSKDYHNLLPAFILTGLGIHFHSISYFSFWPDHLPMFMLIVGIGFLLRYQKTKNGLSSGLFLLVLSVFLLYYDSFMNWLSLLKNGFSLLHKFWPIMMIVVGFYLLFFKKK